MNKAIIEVLEKQVQVLMQTVQDGDVDTATRIEIGVTVGMLLMQIAMYKDAK